MLPEVASLLIVLGFGCFGVTLVWGRHPLRVLRHPLRVLRHPLRVLRHPLLVWGYDMSAFVCLGIGAYIAVQICVDSIPLS